MHLEDQTNHRLLKSRSVFSSRCATKGLLADKLENLYSRIAFIEPKLPNFKRIASFAINTSIGQIIGSDNSIKSLKRKT
jgi:hypothetical protein